MNIYCSLSDGRNGIHIELNPELLKSYERTRVRVALHVKPNISLRVKHHEDVSMVPYASVDFAP